jgi:hypothetical protein
MNFTRVILKLHEIVGLKILLTLIELGFTIGKIIYELTKNSITFR